jgi:hypothetical protein
VCCCAPSGKLTNNINELKADKTQRERKFAPTSSMMQSRGCVYIGPAMLWMQEKDSMMAPYNLEYV